MKSYRSSWRFAALLINLSVLLASAAPGRGDDRLVGIWTRDEGFQVVEVLFRSDGRYQIEKRTGDPVLDPALAERGRYQVNGPVITLFPYDYFGEPQGISYEYQVGGGELSLSRTDFPLTDTYQYQPGSREQVLARQQVTADLIGAWVRPLIFYGQAEYTFRPGGYFVLKQTPDAGEFPPEYLRGRYAQQGTQLVVTPYSGTGQPYELDFFGNTVTLIRVDPFGGASVTYEAVPGSGPEVQAKAAEAAAFLSREHWQVGVWEMGEGTVEIELTLRPDGRYEATDHRELLLGVVRGRYTIESGQIHLAPYVGQGLYSRSNGEFGKVPRTLALDYYDGELQFIDLEALSSAVRLARQRAGTGAVVLEKARLAAAERAQEGWQVGVWEVDDPAGWMEFTFRPDHRYLAKSGANGSPYEVERGWYALGSGKLTLAPYAGLGPARGFELDYYDGRLFLVGDANRLVIARPVPGSAAGVIEKTSDPVALKGERGGMLGRWTANLPGQHVELVFRPDGEFRLTRCQHDMVSHDYGIYAAEVAGRKLVSDSRFLPVQTHGLDFYGDTLTIHGGGLGPPRTYTVNLGTVDADLEASWAADALEAQVDAQWRARVPVGPRDPNAVQIPTGTLPADPNPGRRFEAPTVLQNYQLYRRFTLGFVYFNHQGTIRSVEVVNTAEWHFFPTGRLLVRFRNYRAGVVYPNTIEDVSDGWGAYRLEPPSGQSDVLHRYADDVVRIETDLGESLELTLEDGRRHLFWGKEFMTLSEWATERTPIPCQLPAVPDPSLMNNGVSLTTQVAPDPTGDGPAIPVTLTGPVSGHFTLSGETDRAGTLVVESSSSLVPPIRWQPVLTNPVPAGPFNLLIPQGNAAAAFFRLRAEGGKGVSPGKRNSEGATAGS